MLENNTKIMQKLTQKNTVTQYEKN